MNRTPTNKLLIDTEHRSGCWLWYGSCQPSGYGQLRCNGTMVLAHRRMYELCHGPLADNLQLVTHTCDNRQCVNPKHLVLGSHKQNTQDMVRKGRGRGPTKRLSEKDRTEVRQILRDFPVSQSQVAALYNIDAAVISRVSRRSAGYWR